MAGRWCVSILTRPYGRMLWKHESRSHHPSSFQSSPALTGGCYFGSKTTETNWYLFQSSPALTGGCYFGGGRGFWFGGCFNPHPPLRADAIDSCVGGLVPCEVSILTRPYGRMLSPPSSAQHRSPAVVSILTRPYGRMLFPPGRSERRLARVSILTRPYGRML